MTSRSRDFESRASTNSAIPAKFFLFFFRRGIITENPGRGNRTAIPPTSIIRAMKIQDFDFDLPPELIAQFPAEKRGNSRMLHLDAVSGALQDRMFADLPLYLRPGDVIVFNDTRVIKARLNGVRDTGGRVEVLVERVLDRHRALAAIRASHSPKPGSKLFLADAIEVTVLSREHDFYTLQFEHESAVIELLERYGNLPLPPYISRPVEKSDELRYQTIYAARFGAVAAPTAGLHFDEHMLELLRKMGVVMAHVTLHVGSGTFQPVRVENIVDHRMHSEVFYVSQETVECIRNAKAEGGRILAVGTTSLRALEAAAAAAGGRD